MKFRPYHLWMLLPVFLVIVWFFVFYLPLSFKIKSARTELNAVAGELSKVETEVKAQLQIKEEAEKTEKSLRDLYKSVALADSYPGPLREVAEIARHNGVSVEDINVVTMNGEVIKSAPIMKPVFELTVKGRFFDFARFLVDLERRSAFRGILKGRLFYNDKEYPVLTGKLLIEWKIWKRRAGFAKDK